MSESPKEKLHRALESLPLDKAQRQLAEAGVNNMSDTEATEMADRFKKLPNEIEDLLVTVGLEEKLSKAREALRPFAEIAIAMADAKHDSDFLYGLGKCTINAGDFRKARAVYDALTPPYTTLQFDAVGLCKTCGTELVSRFVPCPERKAGCSVLHSRMSCPSCLP